MAETLSANGASIQITFPAIPGATAFFSEADKSNSDFSDPSNSDVGNFLGVSFFLTIYDSDGNKVTVLPSPIYLEIPASSDTDAIYYYDMDQEKWVDAKLSCATPYAEIDGDVLKVKVCHLTQFGVFKTTETLSAAGSLVYSAVSIVVLIVMALL